MTAAQFKKGSKVTYVLVKGDPYGIVVPASGSAFHSAFYTRRLKYSGYLEVPYSYEDFIAFNENQRKQFVKPNLASLVGVFLSKSVIQTVSLKKNEEVAI